MAFPSRDVYEFKNDADILYRAARPQRHSGYIPRRRDWRYTTGVYQHEDFEDNEKDETIWDKLDADILTGTFGKERRKMNMKRSTGHSSTSLKARLKAKETGLATPGQSVHMSPLSKQYTLTPSEEAKAGTEGNGVLTTPAPTINSSISTTSPNELGEHTTRGVKRKLSDIQQPCNRCREKNLPCVVNQRSEKCVRCRKAGHVCVRDGAGTVPNPAPRGLRPSTVATFKGSKQTGLRLVLHVKKDKLEALEKRSAILRATSALPIPIPPEDRDEVTAEPVERGDTEPLQTRSDALEYIVVDGKRVRDVRLHKRIALRHLLMHPALSIVGSVVEALRVVEERIDAQKDPKAKRARIE